MKQHPFLLKDEPATHVLLDHIGENRGLEARTTFRMGFTLQPGWVAGRQAFSRPLPCLSAK